MSLKTAGGAVAPAGHSLAQPGETTMRAEGPQLGTSGRSARRGQLILRRG